MAVKIRDKVKLNFDEYKDKVNACWIGKNIGGTIGTPYEGTMEYLDVQGFVTEAGAPLPNDDLDLQLVWLHAVEKMGLGAIQANVLGEFWLSFIPPHWNEYGIGKANMKRGLIPPLSGDYQNEWKDSNGAWIRTEVWACLAPACPKLAADFSVEDAKVDHGSGEGTYAAAFVAAMQSAAFALKDIRKCIEIGLAEIPATCRVADSVKFTIECSDKGLAPKDTRDLIQQRNADMGNGWFEAPSNVAYTILGLLYGEGDFKKSMIYAVNCGDDTDCTAATVGATLGIMGGMAAIPEDWKAHIGDDIVTISINKGDACRKVPATCTELTERVVTQAPHIMFAADAPAVLVDGENEIAENIAEEFISECLASRVAAGIKPYSMKFEYSFLTAEVYLDKAPDIEPDGEITVNVICYNRCPVLDKAQYNLTARWWLPEGFSVSGKQTARMPRTSSRRDPMARCYFSFTIKAGESVAASNKCVLEICGDDRMTPMYIPVVLLG